MEDAKDGEGPDSLIFFCVGSPNTCSFGDPFGVSDSSNSRYSPVKLGRLGAPVCGGRWQEGVRFSWDMGGFQRPWGFLTEPDC